MIKYDRNEFLKPQIYSTNNKYETRYIVNNEITDDIKQLQQENKKYKEVIDKLKKAIDECWYMDSENIGEQIFLKKCELLDILKEVE